MNQHHRVVKIGPAGLVETNDGEGFVPAADIEDTHGLFRIESKRTPPRFPFGIGITGEKTFRKTDNEGTAGIGAGETFFESREVVLEIRIPRLELTMRDFHPAIVNENHSLRQAGNSGKAWRDNFIGRLADWLTFRVER